MIYLICSITLLPASWFLRRAFLLSRFRSDVRLLFSQSHKVEPARFSYEQLQGLPAPVERYFKYVLKEGQIGSLSVRLKHTGHFKMKPDGSWIKIKGEEYFSTCHPGFVWKGVTTMFTAIDRYINGKGRLSVFMLSLFRVVNARGLKYDQGELLRWLAEGVWFPVSLLPGRYVQWGALDDKSAKLVFNYAGLSLSYIVRFNDAGEVAEMETQRYYNGNQLETWLAKMKDYKEFNGIKLPTDMEATWKLKEGDYSYARFILNQIEFNVPRHF